MECSFGIVGNGYVLLASDMTSARSIVKMKGDEDKQRVIGNTLAFAYSGEPGDTVQFAAYVEANLTLNNIRNHTPLLPHASASWIRSSLADSLRSRHPYSVNLLVAGYDPTSSEASLFWIDYLGTMIKVPYAAHGYGAYFSLSTMDRFHDPNMPYEEGLKLLKRAIVEVEKRLVISLGKFMVRCIDANGVRVVETFDQVTV